MCSVECTLICISLLTAVVGELLICCTIFTDTHVEDDDAADEAVEVAGACCGGASLWRPPLLGAAG